MWDTCGLHSQQFFFFKGEISLIESQTASIIDIKEKQDTIKQG